MEGKIDIETYLKHRAERVNEWLEKLVPSEEAPPRTLHRAMRYSLLAGGKRLRPVLTLTAGEALGGREQDLMPAACALEMIHTYSLIHDDLPAMDNDDLRRGMPTCHKAFGEAIAILAGDALLTLAFQVLTAELPGRPSSGPDRRIRVIQEVASAAGSINALIGGQVADIENEGRPVNDATLEYIHRSKTGAMITAAVVVGGIVARGAESDLETLRKYGERIGLAFQVADDILDVTSTSEQMGKTPGKDIASRKATYPALHGIEASEARARQLVAEACQLISGIEGESGTLAALARFIIARRS